MMNVTGFTRGLMAKNYNEEEFYKHVASLVESQLKEWNEKYEVKVMTKGSIYKLFVQHHNLFYHLVLSKNDVQFFQENGPFALDRKMWQKLAEQGLPIIRGTGNYLDILFYRNRT